MMTFPDFFYVSHNKLFFHRIIIFCESTMNGSILVLIIYEMY